MQLISYLAVMLEIFDWAPSIVRHVVVPDAVFAYFGSTDLTRL